MKIINIIDIYVHGYDVRIFDIVDLKWSKEIKVAIVRDFEPRYWSAGFRDAVYIQPKNGTLKRVGRILGWLIKLAHKQHLAKENESLRSSRKLKVKDSLEEYLNKTFNEPKKYTEI